MKTRNHQLTAINYQPKPRLDRRTTWERLSQIDDWLRAGGYPNTRTMARRLGVTERTVTRDLQFLKTKRGLPIEYDPHKYGFYYAKPVTGFPKTPLSEADISAMLVAHKGIAQYGGTPFEKPLRAACQKLVSLFDHRGLHSLRALGDALSFRPFAPEASDPRTFRLIARALAERRVLMFNYRNRGKKTVLTRRAHPYHIVCFDNRWYLLAFDLVRNSVRTFALCRLTRPQLTRKRFDAPKKFDTAKYLRGSIGMMKGEYDYEVVIELDAFGADLVRGRRWHPKQEFIELPGGGARLRMVLSGLEEIERAVLSWGTHATVLKPEILRHRLYETSSELSARYADGDAQLPGKDAVPCVPDRSGKPQRSVVCLDLPFLWNKR